MKKENDLTLIGLSSLCAIAFLGGCRNIVLLDPKGPIGDSERFVMVTAFALMLIVVISAIVMTFWFSRRYRASNTGATYTPKWSSSNKIDLAGWLASGTDCIGSFPPFSHIPTQYRITIDGQQKWTAQ
jgi:cytochrome o ubiquinol oxidase subunit 2